MSALVTPEREHGSEPDREDPATGDRDYRRIEHAIRYLETHAAEQPALEDVAAEVGLSPFHFQRLFSRWVGISPKRFVQFLTVEYAKRNLAESHSVLDTTFAVGLSGPGRLHDLFVACEAMTPGEFKRRGGGLELRYGFHDSPFGRMLLLATARGICGLAFVDGTQSGSGDGDAAALDDMRRRWPAADYVRDDAATAPHRAAIAAAFRWDRAPDAAAPLRLFLMGTNFQVRVWEALLRIPLGRVVSYDDLSRRIGRPGAARAVAGAVAANPISLLVPCHRVIRSTGLISGYYWGVPRKRAILAWEAGRSADEAAA